LARADEEAPDAFVDLKQVDATILHDIRYCGHHNFIGRPIRGYREPLCILTRPAAEALSRAQATLLARGYTLKVYDCYRPQRAVDDFARWAARRGDQRMKGRVLPARRQGLAVRPRLHRAPLGPQPRQHPRPDAGQSTRPAAAPLHPR